MCPALLHVLRGLKSGADRTRGEFLRALRRLYIDSRIVSRGALILWLCSYYFRVESG